MEQLRVTFPPELPITERIDELGAAVAAHQVVIVAGETGSGKTTQLPKLCLSIGRGATGQIGCTQPRRIAATSVAARVAEELQTPLGDVVGYTIRFADKSQRSTRIKFMTDGILLAEIQSDPLLRRYDTLIIDEAHERSLNIDFLLGFLKRLLPRRRDLRVIISSATLETERFAKFFDGAPIIEVSGRTYPVDVLYRPAQEQDDDVDVGEHVANVVEEITDMDPRGDILVFLPGEREIREAAGELESHALPHTEILPLYGRLSAADQQRVFQRGRGRRVVLATNVAETSLTIPGIIYVVDTGLARINRYDPRTGVSQLLVEPVSRASADQRKGRCGRTQNGVCFRLYEESDYTTRPAHTDPEIKRTSLAGVILKMKSLGLGEISEFPFLDPPQTRAISDGYRVLEELGAIDEQNELTQIGRQISRLPLDPRLARMILGGRDEKALREIVVITAVLGLRDPRDRPHDKAQQADEAHRKFKDEASDFVSFLKMWETWKTAKASMSRRQLQRMCHDNFLNYNRMREWDDIHEQIVGVMREMELKPNAQAASGEQIHRALLPGLLSRIGMYNREQRNYVGSRQTRFVIHPSSGLAKKPPAWIMAAELVETSQLFARTCAAIDPAWLERAGGNLCRRSYGDPHWEQRSAQVMVKENVTLYGLPVVHNRHVPHARRDPELCRELFITHALVRHEYTTKGAFMAHNQNVLASAQHMRDKARKSDMFADDNAIAEFFDKRLPPDVCAGKQFEQWRVDAEAKTPKILFLSLEDVLLDEAHELTTARYPDQLIVGGVTLPLTYRFDPSEDDDGISITVPLMTLPQLDPDVMMWTIPAWHATKIALLIDSLGKSTRKKLGEADVVAMEVASATRPFDGPMLPAIEKAITALTGERIARDAWDLRLVPRYLDFSYRVVDDKDKVLGTGRDLVELQRALASRARQVWAAVPRESFEKTGLREWSFDKLPEQVPITVGGRRVNAYPALVDADSHVDLRLMESAPAAIAATREGLRRLYMFHAGTSFAKLDAQIPNAIPKDVRRQLVLRAMDEAFELDNPAATPRDRSGFQASAHAGSTRLSAELARLAGLAKEITALADKIRSQIKPLVGKPGVAKALVDDVDSQLAHLVPLEGFATRSFGRLAQVSRYLKALQVRLQRQANDPLKDQNKAQQVVPVWQAYLGKRDQLRAKGRTPEELAEFGWLVEELRVHVFAPELGATTGVSPARVADRWAMLAR